MPQKRKAIRIHKDFYVARFFELKEPGKRPSLAYLCAVTEALTKPAGTKRNAYLRQL